MYISSSAELQMSEHLVVMDFCDLGSAGTFLLPVSRIGGGKATAHSDSFLLTLSLHKLFCLTIGLEGSKACDITWTTVEKLYYPKQENPEEQGWHHLAAFTRCQNLTHTQWHRWVCYVCATLFSSVYLTMYLGPDP